MITFPFNYAHTRGFGEGVYAILATPAFFFSYYLGANALRRRSVAAATMLTTISLVMAIHYRKLQGHYDYQFTAQALLFLNILRGICLAARYQPKADEGPPLTLFAQFGHAIVDRLPQRIWPRFRVAFWILSSLQLGISLLGCLPDRAILFLLNTLDP